MDWSSGVERKSPTDDGRLVTRSRLIWSHRGGRFGPIFCWDGGDREHCPREFLSFDCKDSFVPCLRGTSGGSKKRNGGYVTLDYGVCVPG